MTSIASWGNPLVGADQNATLTHSIYSDLQHSFSSLNREASKLVSSDKIASIEFNDANDVIYNNGDSDVLTISSLDGTTTLGGPMYAQKMFLTSFSPSAASGNEVVTKNYVDTAVSIDFDPDNYYKKTETDAKFETQQGHNNDLSTIQDSLSDISTSLTNIASDISTNYLTKDDAEITYLKKVDSAKMEWTNSSNVSNYFGPSSPTGNALILQYNNNTTLSITPSSGTLEMRDLYPNRISFGSHSVGQDSNKWVGVISNIVDSANKTTADSAAISNQETYVPSYKVFADRVGSCDSRITAQQNDISTLGTMLDNQANVLTSLDTRVTALENNTDSLEWTTPGGNDFKLSPNSNSNLALSSNNVIKTIFAPSNGNIYCNNVYPNVIEFGNTYVGQSQKWSGTIVDIVNNPNKTTADSASDSNKDTYVPSYRVLQENYYTKTESDNRYINVDEPVELIKKSKEIDTFIPTTTYTATTADSGGINLCEQMIIESDEISFTATIQVQVSEGYDVSLLNIGMRVNNEYKYLDSEENGTFSGTLTFSNLTPGTTYTILYGWKTTSGSVKFKITSATLSYSLNTSLGNYYSKKEVENLKKWSWANSSNTWTFEPQRNSGINGAYQNALKMTEDGTTVIRMVPSGIYAETFSPESMIQFGKTITGGNVSGRWRSSIVGVANDNYNPTTYSTVDTDTIVPSLKYLNSNYYPKSYVDALEARVAALENALSGQ